MVKEYKQHKRGKAAQEHWTKMQRSTMETPAWRSLSTAAQSAYVWIKFEWKGPNANNNGKIQVSLRQLAQCMGINPETAGRAMLDLQKAGFTVVTRCAQLGVQGRASGHLLEITELPLPGDERGQGRRLFEKWMPGNDFPIVRPQIRNPKGGDPPSRKKATIDR
ncbi:hypothetical protein [Antarctobacter sp.]|uniref:hypothetical protein n=1 Tax=Antarctobacter sp. TaxID=1872577 RepID=UPI002B26ECA4|nr:hypothetical protein [Antarctobacter sp.]